MNVVVHFISLQAYSRHYVVKLISVLFCRSVHAQLLAYYTCTNYFIIIFIEPTSLWQSFVVSVSSLWQKSQNYMYECRDIPTLITASQSCCYKRMQWNYKGLIPLIIRTTFVSVQWFQPHKHKCVEVFFFLILSCSRIFVYVMVKISSRRITASFFKHLVYWPKERFGIVDKNEKQFSRVNTAFHVTLSVNLYDGEHPIARDAN